MNTPGMPNTSTFMSRIAFIGLWLFIFTIPWERSIAVPGIGALGRLIGIGAIGLGALSVARGGGVGGVRLRPPSLFLALMGLFVTWSALSFLWSVDPVNTLVRASTYVQLWLMVWLVWQLCRHAEQQRALLAAYVLGCYLSVGAVLANFVTGRMSVDYSRYSAFGDNVNYVAIAIALGLPMAWYLTLHHRGARFLGYLAFVPLALLAVGLTGSRGGLLICLTALGVIPLTFHRLTVRRKSTLTVVLASMLLGVYAALPPANWQRLSETSVELRQGSLTHRRDIWRAGATVFLQRPFFGSGSGSFPVATEPLLSVRSAPHNAFVAVSVELGLVGLLIFSTLLIVAALPLLRLRALERSFYGVLWVTLLVAFMPANWEYEKASWLILALLTTRAAFVVTGVKTAEIKRPHAGATVKRTRPASLVSYSGPQRDP